MFEKKLFFLHSQLRTVIHKAALEIESCRYKSSEDAIESMQLTFNQRSQVSGLLSADKKVNVSFQSLKVTTELFSLLNDYIVHQIENSEISDNKRTEGELLFANAILVYELCDFAIRFFESYELSGVHEIAETQRLMQGKIGHLEEDELNLRKKVESDKCDQNLRNQFLSDIENRQQAILIVKKEWDNYASSIQELSRSVDIAKKNLPTLMLIRENAKNQINVLELAAIMQIVRSNVTALRSAISTLKSVKLVTLTPNRIQRLLNISIDSDDNKLFSGRLTHLFRSRQ